MHELEEYETVALEITKTLIEHSYRDKMINLSSVEARSMMDTVDNLTKNVFRQISFETTDSDNKELSVA